LAIEGRRSFNFPEANSSARRDTNRLIKRPTIGASSNKPSSKSNIQCRENLASVDEPIQIDNLGRLQRHVQMCEQVGRQFVSKFVHECRFIHVRLVGFRIFQIKLHATGSLFANDFVQVFRTTGLAPIPIGNLPKVPDQIYVFALCFFHRKDAVLLTPQRFGNSTIGKHVRRGS
jgi:hypothetical protein